MTFLKKHGFTFFKWLIVAASMIFLVQRIFFDQSFKSVFSNFNLTVPNLLLFIIVLLLMIVNWGIEAIKWKYAVKTIYAISFKRAFAAVLAGVSVSLFMPNRTGEFIGRIFALPSEKRIQGVFASFVTSYAQFNITLITGTIALCFFFFLYPDNVLSQKNISVWIIIPCCLVTIVSLFFYLKIKWFWKLIEKIKFLKKYLEKVNILSSYKVKALCFFILISFLRYFVFVVQFHFLIRFFGIEISFWDSILAIILTFYITTIIPTFSLAEIGVRGSVAVLFFGFFSQSFVEIVSASTLLWLINVGVPAIIGNVLLAKFKESD